MFGVRRAKHILAINNNPEAPIFKGADFGVVGDWAQVVPALTQAINEARERAGGNGTVNGTGLKSAKGTA